MYSFEPLVCLVFQFVLSFWRLWPRQFGHCEFNSKQQTAKTLILFFIYFCTSCPEHVTATAVDSVIKGPVIFGRINKVMWYRLIHTGVDRYIKVFTGIYRFIKRYSRFIYRCNSTYMYTGVIVYLDVYTVQVVLPYLNKSAPLFCYMRNVSWSMFCICTEV